MMLLFCIYVPFLCIFFLIYLYLNLVFLHFIRFKFWGGVWNWFSTIKFLFFFYNNRCRCIIFFSNHMIKYIIVKTFLKINIVLIFITSMQKGRLLLSKHLSHNFKSVSLKTVSSDHALINIFHYNKGRKIHNFIFSKISIHKYLIH